MTWRHRSRNYFNRHYLIIHHSQWPFTYCLFTITCRLLTPAFSVLVNDYSCTAINRNVEIVLSIKKKLLWNRSLFPSALLQSPWFFVHVDHTRKEVYAWNIENNVLMCIQGMFLHPFLFCISSRNFILCIIIFKGWLTQKTSRRNFLFYQTIFC